MQILIDPPEKVKMARIIALDPILRAVLTKSHDELEQWLDTNIVTAADAIKVLKKTVMLCWYLAHGLKELYPDGDRFWKFLASD